LRDTLPIRKRYATVGTGDRAGLYRTILLDFAKTADLVAFRDTNQTRIIYANKQVSRRVGWQGYQPSTIEFDTMIRETKLDTVIVTKIDQTQKIYIVRAMELVLM
jgi:predicted dehydrogenase